jgi:endonuclease/exonuclease/phosphatase family metal-dependent hydrolase
MPAAAPALSCARARLRLPERQTLFACLARDHQDDVVPVNSSGEVILASMNVHGGRGRRGEPFDVGQACRALAADVTVLQEAWRTRGQPDPLVEAAQDIGAQVIHAALLPDTDLSTLGIARDPAPGRWGLAVLTTLPVTGYEVVELGRAVGDMVARAAQLVTVTTPGGASLRVVNTHLTHRFLSPVQLIRLVRRLAADQVATVITGDLNMPGPVTGLAVGYSPAVRGRTFPAHRPLIQLDHMLTGRGVRAHGGEVLPPAGSDHRAIRACVCAG